MRPSTTTGSGRTSSWRSADSKSVRVEVLDVRRVRSGRLEVAARRRRDAGLPAVRHDERAVELGELGDPPDLRQPAAATDVRLEHVHAAVLQPLAALVDGRGELGAADPGRHPLGQLRMPVEVVVAERRLREEDVAVLDPLERPERVRQSCQR